MRTIFPCILWLNAFAPSVVLSQQADSILPEQVCAHPSRFVGPCVTIRGRLGYANGGIPVQMWKVGTHRMLGVNDETYQSPFCVLPGTIRKLLDDDKSVFADFVVRPLTPEVPGVMQRVCVVSATNVRTEPAYFINPAPAVRPSDKQLGLTPPVMPYLFGAAAGALIVIVLQFLASLRARRRWRPRVKDSFQRFEGLIVRDERGTTEIDEVIVTPAGVFVIEKKDFNAWIFGNKDDEYWTASYPNRETYRFQNPLRQNYRHIKALESVLRVSRSVMSSVVAFSERSRLMKELPPEVLDTDHVAFVRSQQRVALSPDEFDSICSGLRALESSSDGASFDQHVEDLHERFENQIQCPKCGGRLVQRQSRKPGDERNLFLGCSNFPSCRYIRNLDAN